MATRPRPGSCRTSSSSASRRTSTPAASSTSTCFPRPTPASCSGSGCARSSRRDPRLAERREAIVRIAVIGGGPGGLYFAALAKQLGPQHEITVWERNAADDTFGVGVVFSDETLGGIEHADAEIHRRMEREFARWDDIDVHFRGEVITSGGHGFAALGRRRLLEILHERCADLGVVVHFRTEAPDTES